MMQPFVKPIIYLKINWRLNVGVWILTFQRLLTIIVLMGPDMSFGKEIPKYELIFEQQIDDSWCDHFVQIKTVLLP